MKTKVLAFLISVLISSNSLATWTDFAEVGQLQSYGEGLQVWLNGVGCPNEKSYFSVKESYTAKFDTIVSMVLMAKASKTKIKFEYNAVDDSTFCFVTGIRVE